MASAGDRVDKFTLVRQLGAGGMGETWEAVRQSGHEFEQRVAIKLADADVLSSPEGMQAFRREASLAASLRHPNIAAVLDVDERGSYIVCELVDGADLRAVLRAARGGKLSAPVLIHIVAQIARGLSHAHRRMLRGQLSPVIHRDMSPGNVVIDYDGNVKIVDFGIAKATAVASEGTEAVRGKLSYMAPEQAMGASMDGRVDQYALGVIAYEALSGVRPNDGPHDGATLGCILSGKHVPILEREPSLDPRLAAIVERMLALAPEQRFASLEAVLDALGPLTPALSVHRELVPLVMRARQPHTIVRENGQFVSRPVDVHVPSTAPDSEAAWAARAHPSAANAPSAAPPATDAAVGTQRAGDAPRASRRPPPSAAERKPAAKHAGSATGPSTFRSRSRTLRLSIASRFRAWLDALLAAPAFWHALTALGALLLAFVAWVAISPNALRLLGLLPAPGQPPRAPIQSVEAATARVTIIVFPEGHVWVDQQLRGETPPQLELNLAPGQHVIAAGRDAPVQSRVVDLAAGSTQLLRFELEGS